MTHKAQFPIFKRKIKGKPIIYLDSAASTQKPQAVIGAVSDFYKKHYSNINRGIYTLSEEATDLYEQTRQKTAKFINAKSEKEIIFTRSCTESINLVAYTWGEKNIKKDDEIIISALEHHANLVPWQELCLRKKAKLKIIPLKKDLTLDLNTYQKLLNKKTKLVAITGMSNVTGLILPVKKIITLAHQAGALTLVDGAQSVAHSATDVQKLDCDFLAFSSHKMLGPSGIGVLYGKQEILEAMPPFNFGGDMIKYVEQYSSTYNDLPWKFEAGTPNIEGVAGFSAALDFLTHLGFKTLQTHEHALTTHARHTLSKIPQVTLFTPPLNQSGGIISFTVEGIHPHDLATILNQDNICLRAGHHCAHPLMHRLQIPATARISFHIYNQKSDILALARGIQKAIKIFS